MKNLLNKIKKVTSIQWIGIVLAVHIMPLLSTSGVIIAGGNASEVWEAYKVGMMLTLATVVGLGVIYLTVYLITNGFKD